MNTIKIEQDLGNAIITATGSGIPVHVKGVLNEEVVAFQALVTRRELGEGEVGIEVAPIPDSLVGLSFKNGYLVHNDEINIH